MTWETRFRRRESVDRACGLPLLMRCGWCAPGLVHRDDWQEDRHALGAHLHTGALISFGVGED
jgi:hypothetical protein